MESQLAPSFKSIEYEKHSDSDEADEYSDQFEEEDEDESAYMGSTGQSKSVKAQSVNRDALDQQVHLYRQMLDITNSGFTQYEFTSGSAAQKMQTPTLLSQKSQHTESKPILTMRARHESQKQQIREQMGPQLYDRVFKILVMCKNQDESEEVLQEHLKQVKKMSSTMRNLVFKLEEIVWMSEEL